MVNPFVLWGLVGGLMLAAFLLGMEVGERLAQDKCYSGYVALSSSQFPDGSNFVIIGDATFCGELSNIVGPSKLYSQERLR